MNLEIEGVVIFRDIEKADLNNSDHTNAIINGIREVLELIEQHQQWVKKTCDCSAKERKGVTSKYHSSECATMMSQSPVEIAAKEES
jgi:putative protein kinase ArgK-like GTPase of G3E family